MTAGACLRWAGLAAALFAAVTPAAAQYRPAAPATQLAMPTAVPAEERTYSRGEVLLHLPILWARAATLREAATVEADGRSETLAAGTVLGAQRLFSASGGAPGLLHAPPRGRTRDGSPGERLAPGHDGPAALPGRFGS